MGGGSVGAEVDVETMTAPVGKGAVWEAWADGSAVDSCEAGAAGLTAQAHSPSASSIQVHLATNKIIAQNQPGD